MGTETEGPPVANASAGPTGQGGRSSHEDRDGHIVGRGWSSLRRVLSEGTSVVAGCRKLLGCREQIGGDVFAGMYQSGTRISFET